MTEAMFTNLSDGQRDCLRLVIAHMNSKEIGRELGISPHTVDQRLRRAMRAMDVSSRFEAARKFARHECIDPYQPLIYQPSDVENSDKTANLCPSAKRNKDVDDDLIAGTSDVENGSAALVSDSPARKKNRWPFPRYRGEKNQLSHFERLGWMVVIAIGAAVSFGGILAGLEALSRLSG